MNYYESSANNTADSISPSVCTRLTGDIADGTLKELRLTARNIPPVSLRERPQWVCWQATSDCKKIPIDPTTGKSASVNEPSTWSKYETAVKHYQQTDVDGLGFVFTTEGQFVGVDLDGCRNPENETIDKWAQDIVAQLDSYTEYSPSRTGLHVLLKGEIPSQARNQNKERGIEVYDSNRFFTVTADPLDTTPLSIKQREEELLAVHVDYVGNPDVDSTAVTGSVEMGLEPDEDKITLANSCINEFYSDSRTSRRACEYLTDLMKGRYRKRGFIADDGSADRSKAEYVFAGLLIGVFTDTGEGVRALNLTSSYITHACQQNPRTADGQQRKWTQRHDGSYPQKTVLKAFTAFDYETWERWRRKGNGWQTWTDEYSDVTYDIVWQAVCELADEDSRDYPTKSQVIERAQEKDNRSEHTHKEALKRLRRKYGQVKLAHLGGNAYVYYPSSFPHPEDAKRVKADGDWFVPSDPPSL